MRIRERFNPRAPCGARQNVSPNQSIIAVFQPTRPLRGATGYKGKCDHRDHISTHAPLAGRDERHCCIFPRLTISTHAPLAGRDIRGRL